LSIEETSVFGTIVKKDEETDSDSDEEPKTDEKKGKKRFPPIPKIQHESSTSAADDVFALRIWLFSFGD